MSTSDTLHAAPAPPRDAAPDATIWPAARRSRRRATFATGAVLLLIATAAAVTMAMGHLGAITVPGCGAGSACDAAASSWFGKVPGTAWPISFVGTAYFTALLSGWLLAGGRTSSPLRGLIWLGAIFSLLYIAVMINGGYLCKYCLVIHACNLLFCALTVWGAERTSAQRGPLVAIALIFVLANAGLGVAQSVVRARFLQAQEEENNRSLELLRQQVEAQRRRAADQSATPTAPATNAAPHEPETLPIQMDPTLPIGPAGNP